MKYLIPAALLATASIPAVLATYITNAKPVSNDYSSPPAQSSSYSTSPSYPVNPSPKENQTPSYSPYEIAPSPNSPSSDDEEASYDDDDDDDDEPPPSRNSNDYETSREPSSAQLPEPPKNKPSNDYTTKESSSPPSYEEPHESRSSPHGYEPHQEDRPSYSSYGDSSKTPASPWSYGHEPRREERPSSGYEAPKSPSPSSKQHSYEPHHDDYSPHSHKDTPKSPASPSSNKYEPHPDEHSSPSYNQAPKSPSPSSKQHGYDDDSPPSYGETPKAPASSSNKDYKPRGEDNKVYSPPSYGIKSILPIYSKVPGFEKPSSYTKDASKSKYESPSSANPQPPIAADGGYASSASKPKDVYSKPSIGSYFTNKLIAPPASKEYGKAPSFPSKPACIQAGRPPVPPATAIVPSKVGKQSPCSQISGDIWAAARPVFPVDVLTALPEDYSSPALIRESITMNGYRRARSGAFSTHADGHDCDSNVVDHGVRASSAAM
ncbi:hypothetical protein AeNC1_016383, partial [Aphanomyces euteiches]